MRYTTKNTTDWEKGPLDSLFFSLSAQNDTESGAPACTLADARRSRPARYRLKQLQERHRLGVGRSQVCARNGVEPLRDTDRMYTYLPMMNTITDANIRTREQTDVSNTSKYLSLTKEKYLVLVEVPGTSDSTKYYSHSHSHSHSHNLSPSAGINGQRSQL